MRYHKRGPEELELNKEGVNLNYDSTSNYLHEDIGMRGPGRELATMICDYDHWSYFVTITCNLAKRLKCLDQEDKACGNPFVPPAIRKAQSLCPP